ncbi:hypothetical protein AMTRI_Chr10g233560 [Amborella trichopoda]
MAVQAARLTLRMQKEVKMLQTDPPPGIVCVHLSSSSSLTNLEAHLKGPEGTVYSQGLFKIKVQVPDRYPFRPPNVTFMTPIYHPNIDDGGRICLDILNLPPKGAWQPSLNISTILMSIGLLLSEPNPDDGLVREASAEYKYNRQVFEEKARSWTQRYALEEKSSSANTKASIGKMPPMVEQENHNLKQQRKEGVESKKLNAVSKKLSLESSFSGRSNTEESHKTQFERSLSIGLSVSTGSSQLLPLATSTPGIIHQQPKASNLNQVLPLDYDLDAKSLNQKVEFTGIIVSDSESEEDEQPSQGCSLRQNHFKRKVSMMN